MTITDDNDAFVSNDTDSGSQYAGNLGITNAIDTNPVSTIPLVESGKNIYTGISQGEWTDIAGGVADLGANAFAFALDPLNWLISAGLTFLIDFIQPLEDLLSLVTGNAERMEPYAQTWQQLGTALVPLGAATQQAATDHLIEWQGKDATAAKTRLTEFGEGIKATGGEAASISGLLILFSKLMNAAQQIIIGIMASLIEWMILTWVAAMAAAPETLGGSVAVAGAATEVEATVATSRAVEIIDRVVSLLTKIGGLLNKILPGPLKANVGKAVVDFTSSPATWSTAGRIALAGVKDWKGYAGPGVTGATGGAKWGTAGGTDMSDEEIDKKVDPNR